MPCRACRNVGWILIDHHAGEGGRSGAVSLELVPCNLADCPVHPPRPIATLGVRGQFREVVRHPNDGTIMALTGFTEPAWR
jgi:hypothetical protein